MKTLLLIADGLLWEPGIADCPGAVLPTAKEKLAAACAAADRVVVASYCANTHLGAQRCRRILVSDLGADLSDKLDLHTAAGFPLFDEVWHE